MTQQRSKILQYFCVGLLLINQHLSEARKVNGKKNAAFRPTPKTADIVTTKTSDGIIKYTHSTTNDRNAAKIQRGGQQQVANTLSNSLLGAIGLALIEKIAKEGLAAANIKFPAGLGACIGLFFALLVLDIVSPNSATSIFNALTPGAALLTKWLPVMFVPGLVCLPLSPPIGGTADIIKILVTVVVGFLYSATTTIIGVAAVQQITGKGPKPRLVRVHSNNNVVSTVSPPALLSNNKVVSNTSPPPSAAKPFSDETWNLFWIGTVSSGILSLLATKLSFEYSTLLQTIFLTFVTGASYIWSARLPTSFVKVIHPLVTSSILILASIRGLGLVTGVEFLDVLRSYKTGKLFPLHKTGAGDLLMYSLGPSVVSFAVAMFGRRQLLSTNLLGVATAMLIASFGGLFGTAFFVKLIGIGGNAKNGALIRLSLIARNITTALALPLTAMLGGDLSIAAAVVCLTGILGASYGKLLLNALKVTDPLLRGLAIGSSAQGLGVASMVDESDAFPFAAIAMVLTAVAGTTLAAIPSIQKALIDAAT